jgi:hypothetical protein
MAAWLFGLVGAHLNGLVRSGFVLSVEGVAATGLLITHSCGARNGYLMWGRRDIRPSGGVPVTSTAIYIRQQQVGLDGRSALLLLSTK